MPGRYLTEHREQIVRAWADELAAHLGRAPDEILARGLGPRDFAFETVRVVFDDGSQATFEYAFYVRSEAKGAIAIFTEHCGYFVVGSWERVSVVPPEIETAEYSTAGE